MAQEFGKWPWEVDALPAKEFDRIIAFWKRKRELENADRPTKNKPQVFSKKKAAKPQPAVSVGKFFNKIRAYDEKVRSEQK